MPTTKIAFLGLGLMGSGMAGRLLDAGFPLTVYNRNAERAAPLGARGARVASSPRDAAAGADVIISMLADDDACRSVWLGDHGALSGARRGAILIESSTVTLGWIRELTTAARHAGCDLLDAPVTGSKLQAAGGELLFLVGGAEESLAAARPVLASMSRDIVHLGPGGSGTLMKLINNFMCGVQLASLAEALALIERGGLDVEKAAAVLTGGTPGSPFVKTLAPRMMARNYQPHFLLKLMAKDMRYTQAQGEALGVDLRTAAVTLELLREAIAAGKGEQDLSSVAEMFRE
jgi:3-hydroxyisobutyrate dehydrogenase